MKSLRLLVTLALVGLAVAKAKGADQPTEWFIDALSPQSGVYWEPDTGLVRGTNGVVVRYGGAVLTADDVIVSQVTGEVIAQGGVRIQHEDQVWVGENVYYNFKTQLIEARQFRTGRSPVFAAGHDLHGEYTNQVYAATNAYVTTDDISEPAVRVKASQITIYPGDRIVARHATLYAGNLPVFYFPYYSHPLEGRPPHFNFIPGYRTSFGPFLLSTYYWYLNNAIDGAIHLDYRQKRGVGFGPDLNLHLGRWGEASMSYYYTHDEDPSLSTTNQVPSDRQQAVFSYLAFPYTNFSIRSQARWDSDSNFEQVYFEKDYRRDPQPNTFVEMNRFWRNFSLDVVAQPRVDDFLNAVERLPDVRWTGYRQQLWGTPVYYESESSGGYYQRLFAETNGIPGAPSYAAARFDTFHQFLLPETFFGWLNVIPRVGGRYTYYSEASGPGATTSEVNRGIFNTGAEVNFKASRVWPGARSSFFQVDGIRHIFQPYVDYVYIPEPNAAGTNVIPQFDYILPSLRLLPITFPDFNSIDSIVGQNVLRMGMRNKLQTKREGAVANLANWNLYTDWNIVPRPGQPTFSDIFSDLTIRPFSWLTLESVMRYEPDGNLVRFASQLLTLQPNNAWSWTFGQFYLANDTSSSPLALGPGESTLTSSLFFRLNENWGFRATQRYNILEDHFQEQIYTVYRDLRLWTAALSCRFRQNPSGPEDFTIAFTFSLKAFPRYSLGTDAAHPYYLLGD